MNGSGQDVLSGGFKLVFLKSPICTFMFLILCEKMSICFHVFIKILCPLHVSFFHMKG